MGLTKQINNFFVNDLRRVYKYHKVVFILHDEN